MNDFIEAAKSKISQYLDLIYKDMKFTLFYNGEFLIAAAGQTIVKKNLIKLPDCISSYDIHDNKMTFDLSKSWIRKSVSNICEIEFVKDNLNIYSQIVRLQKQIDYGFTDGKWKDEMYP